MPIIMYDLAGAEDRRFSPYCWRTRMALAHKGLECDARATRFTEIPDICGGTQKTVPVIVDGENTVADSWHIADYLEQIYPDRPSLFGGDSGRALARFIDSWVASVVHVGLVGMVVKDIHDSLEPPDQAYFRADREKRFGATLEEVQGDREDRLDGFRRSLFPLRHCLRSQDFLGGDTPHYADYIGFGAFQWVRTVSDFRVVEEDDAVWAWLERCRDLHGGFARTAKVHY